MTGRLEGKIAVMAGCGFGPGATMAELFAREGALVVIGDESAEGAEATAAQIRDAGGTAIATTLDVTSEASWAALAALTEREHGRADILVNEIGFIVREQFTDTKIEDWERQIAINLTGPMLGMRTIVPLLRASGGGSIVNIGTIAAIMGHPHSAYSAAKWGMRGLSKSVAMELVDFNIRVNCVHPGLLDTPTLDKSSRLYHELKTMTPMDRPLLLDELAQAVLFLASDDSKFMTGTDLAVDGGLTDIGCYRAVWKNTNAA